MESRQESYKNYKVLLMIDLAGMMVSMESQPVQIYTTFNMLTTHAKHVTDTERSILLLSN